jgi:hypothetical protein
MKRTFSIVVLFAILSAFAAPVLLAADHHEDNSAAQHVNCDGDCGCMCHAGLQGVAKSEHHDILLPVAPATDLYRSVVTPGISVSIDRPPKQFS